MDQALWPGGNGELELLFLMAIAKVCSCERDRSSGSKEKKTLGHNLRN